MKSNEDELLNLLYADNLLLKAQIKLLRHLVSAMFLGIGDENAPEKINHLYYSLIDKYYEDEILASPLKDVHLQSMADEFLKKIKDELK